VISDPHNIQALQQTFGFLISSEGWFFREFLQTATLVHLDKDEHICDEGRACPHLALVINGSARVYKLGESGREITLYRVGPGQSCVLTASCILSDHPFPAFAVCETGIEAAVIPATVVNRWLTESPVWRDYIFGLVAQRLGNIISIVEEVAFKRMDRRIADFLLKQLPGQERSLHATHQQIASDLGTSREVVSRILKDFESSDLIHVGRGHIELLDPEGIKSKSRDS